jgi:DHA1 family bicyclomycin/chloramphenicol resistance-like MFS transporter
MTSVADPALETPAAQALASTFVGRRYVQLVVVLGALMAIGPLTIDTYLPALPQLSAEMGATDSQAQLTITGLLLGLGFGQLIIGPLSDAFGGAAAAHGLGAHGAMSLLCAAAPSIGLLTVTRILQASPVPRSRWWLWPLCATFTGIRAAQLLSRLILVLGVAPILAPSPGQRALLNVTSWRGIFVALALAAVGLLGVGLAGAAGDLCRLAAASPPLRGSVRAYGWLFRDPMFVSWSLWPD